ncbi:uncharacterized protein [Antedon mediterranea]|uniref:uncharacterized protein n=1 Tax=Antedon mediterranea TaxID=105859 RepID=UPI003AF437D0
MSVEDHQFMNIMDNNAFRDDKGSWVAPLPFKPLKQPLPDNRDLAQRRFNSLCKTLNKKPEQKKQFIEFIGNMVKNKHAEAAPPMEEGKERWYLPMFGVYHPQKPGKIRVVFDSSAEWKGVSLNKVLLSGPDLNNSFLGVLLRFRKEPIAVTADVEQMFYCFNVREDHCDYLRYMWFKDNNMDNEVIDYRMKVHVFGNTPSPSMSIYCMGRTAKEYEQKYGSEASQYILRNFYVDDGLTSLPTAVEAIALIQKSKAMLAESNLHLHKIASNSEQVMAALDEADKAKDLQNINLKSEIPPCQRSLGVSWDLETDSFNFKISAQKNDEYTRRGVLSVVNSLFDPLGLVSLITLQGKILVRKLSSGTVDWDAPLNPEYKEEWDSWKQSLVHMENLKITLEEISAARIVVVQAVQEETYLDEIACLKRRRPLPKTGTLRNLDPILGDDGLLRIGGRSENLEIDYNQKHPIILPADNHVATLIARYHHRRVAHQGRHITEGAIRSGGYWVIGRKRLVSTMIYKCVTCRKLRGKTATQKMADLPLDRITPSPPFTSVGIDVFGPWNVTSRRTRGGSANSKRWAVIFSCMSTRAVHIEVLETMTASSLINALRRFFALRGPARIIQSDRGTNFVGAVRELNLQIGTHDVKNFLQSKGCKWIFNPPHSSHMGGAWERMI